MSAIPLRRDQTEQVVGLGSAWLGASFGPATGPPKESRPTWYDEPELVERAKRDPLQFAPLYDRHFEHIYRFAYSRVRDQVAAEDITSEVFAKALKAMPRYKYTGAPFAAWLYRIAVNTIADRGRTLRPSQPIDNLRDLSDGFSTEEVAVHRDEIDRIWNLVDHMPCDQRTALVLKFKEDMTIVDISVVMGKTPGAVKLLIHRGLTRLRKQADALRPAAEPASRPLLLKPA